MVVPNVAARLQAGGRHRRQRRVEPLASLVKRAVDVGGPMLERRARERRNDHVDLAVAALAPVLDLGEEGTPADGLIGQDQHPVDGVVTMRDLGLARDRALGPAPQDADADSDLQRKERGADRRSREQRQGDHRAECDGDDHDGAKDVSLGSKRIVHPSPPFSGLPDYRAPGRRRPGPSSSAGAEWRASGPSTSSRADACARREDTEVSRRSPERPTSRRTRVPAVHSSHQELHARWVRVSLPVRASVSGIPMEAR